MELVLVLIFSGNGLCVKKPCKYWHNWFCIEKSNQNQVKKKILIFENFFVDFLFQIVHKFLTLLIYDYS